MMMMWMIGATLGALVLFTDGASRCAATDRGV
jgi:hypothetical protein